MAGLSNSTHQNRFPDIKVDWRAFLSTWSLKHADQVEGQPLRRIFTENEPLPSSGRLLIIIPDSTFDHFRLLQRIWDLATPEHREVLLLTQPAHEENVSHLRFDITVMANRIRDAHIKVESQWVQGMTIEQAVQQAALPDDVLICFEEHRVRSSMRTERMAKILVQKTSLPVVTLRGEVSETESTSTRLIDLFLLAICIASLVGFFLLEVWIDQNSTGAIHTILEILAVLAEVWTIAACANKSFKI